MGRNATLWTPEAVRKLSEAWRIYETPRKILDNVPWIATRFTYNQVASKLQSVKASASTEEAPNSEERESDGDMSVDEVDLSEDDDDDEVEEVPTEIRRRPIPASAPKSSAKTPAKPTAATMAILRSKKWPRGIF